MVDSQIELIAVDVRSVSIKRFCTFKFANPSVAGSVQAIADCEIVRERHSLDNLLNLSRWIERWSKRISGLSCGVSEYAEETKVPRCCPRFYRVAQTVDCGGA